jgi:DNA-binding transcriptional LysR family regulator
MPALDGLDIFVRTVRAESFSGAARRLGLTPSAVSKQIGRLEDRLGVRLFNRTTRRLALTEEGRAFFERAERILGDLEDAERAISALHAAPRGRLRVSLPMAFGRLRISPLMAEFVRRYPEVTVDLVFNDRFVDLVEEGMDAAVRIGELTDSSLVARRLMDNRRIVCAAPDYIARTGEPREPEDLRRHNCLVYTYRQQRNDWRFFCPGEGEVTVTVSGSLEANNAEAIRDAALAGVGAALLPTWLVGEDLEEGRLAELLPRHHQPDSAVYAVYPAGRHLSPKVRAFIDFLVEKLSQGHPLLERKMP